MNNPEEVVSGETLPMAKMSAAANAKVRASVAGKRQASSKENNNAASSFGHNLHSSCGFVQHNMKFNKGGSGSMNSTSTGPTHKTSHKQQALTNRYPSFHMGGHGQNSTARVIHHPALIQATREGPSGNGSALSNNTTTLQHHHLH